MERYELEAWLGPALDDLTSEQVDRLMAESDRIDARYPDADHEIERQTALGAAVGYLLGDTTADDAARGLANARREQDLALATSRQIAAMLVDDKVLSERDAAPAVGIDRMTLRDYLGKPRKRRAE